MSKVKTKNFKKSRRKPHYYRNVLKRNKRLTTRIEISVFIFVIFIFFLKISNYLNLNTLNPLRLVVVAESAYKNTAKYIDQSKYLHSCPTGYLKIDVGQEYLCRQPTANSNEQKIFDSYPRNPNGNEVIYPYLNSYSPTVASDFIKNQYDVPRFKPITITTVPTWNEDPYKDTYWRFNFYSLRIFKDLLNGYSTTHNPQDAQKLIAITNSFLDNGTKQPHAWDDFHAVAWRTMMLTDIWWKLRANNALPIDTSNKILASLEQHGNFLLDVNHYQSQYNHGTNEAAALYELAVSFPGLPNSSQWLSVSKQRLSIGLSGIIDKNGALVEHSPYYDFYALVKYWDIYKYSNDFKQSIGNDFNSKISSMINYATYILQPNLHVPIIGSSIDAQIHNKDEYTQMAKFDPEFKYVLTKGASGKKPKELNVQFQDTGQTIMRSSWSPKNFTQQTQVIFNYSAYITSHSQLDSLSFELAAGGISLLPGPGLYSYDLGAYHNYFFGTSSHNTVMVDNKDQTEGAGVAGSFVNTKDYVSQSATEQLNPGVTHERQISMFGAKVVIVIDRLSSNTIHNYQQLFHTFPGATVSKNGLTVTAQGGESQQKLSIHQLITNGVSVSDAYNDKDPKHLAGLCSVTYGQLAACHQISYTQTAKDATYATVLEVGKPDPSLSYMLIDNNSKLMLKEGGKTYTINIVDSASRPTIITATDPKPEIPAETVIDDFSKRSNWQTVNGVLSSSSDTYKTGSPAVALTNDSKLAAVTTKKVSLDLTSKNLLIRIKLPSNTNVGDLDLVVYTDTNSYAQNRLKNSYDDIHDNDQTTGTNSIDLNSKGWTNISLGKGTLRDQQGQWSIYGNNFNWSKVTAIAFRISSNDGKPVSVLLGTISTTPAQSEGKVSIVFDDGTSSILPAVNSMQQHGYHGNIAVIGKYPSRGNFGYLTVAQLKSIQSTGWSIVNHSYYHQDAVAAYYDTGKLNEFESDVLSGAEFLETNGIDTDPNWYIYPHGTTNTTIETILGKYYKYARTELTAPEVYPFGNPLAVKDFIVENDTTPQAVEKAITDANTYHQTLLLTFHRIHAVPSDRAGYDLTNFNNILDYLSTSKSHVMSLNELDKSDGVSINHFHIQTGYPTQLKNVITEKKPSWWQRLKNAI